MNMRLKSDFLGKRKKMVGGFLLGTSAHYMPLLKSHYAH